MNISDIDVMLKKIDSEIEALLDTKKALTSLQLSLSGSNGTHVTGKRGPYTKSTFTCKRCEGRTFKNHHALAMHQFRKHTRKGNELAKRNGKIGGALTKAKSQKT